MREILDWILRKGWTFKRVEGGLVTPDSKTKWMSVSYFIQNTLSREQLEDLLKMESFVSVSAGTYDEIMILAHEKVE